MVDTVEMAIVAKVAYQLYSSVCGAFLGVVHEHDKKMVQVLHAVGKSSQHWC